MAKKKDKKKDKEKEVVLTEWQKRNVEFLKKKQEAEAEKEMLREKLKVERRPKLPEKSEEESDEQKASEKKAKEQKKKKVKKEKKDKKEKTAYQKAVERALPVLIVSILICLTSIFMITPYSKQKAVKVDGIVNASETDILAGSDIKDSDYIFSLIFNHKDYEKNTIDSNLWIKGATLSYQFPNRFTLTVDEYEIIAYAQTDNGYQPVLENGTRADIVSDSALPESFLIINLKDEKMVQDLIKAFNKLDKSLVKQIKTVSLAESTTTKDLLNIEMHEGHLVRVPLSEIIKKLPYYSQIASGLNEWSIVDMEVGLYATDANIEAMIIEGKIKAAEEEAAKTEEEANEEAQDGAQDTDAETRPEGNEEAATADNTDEE